jgi:hypothetical protein
LLLRSALSLFIATALACGSGSADQATQASPEVDAHQAVDDGSVPDTAAPEPDEGSLLSDGSPNERDPGELIVLPAQFTEEATPMRMLAESDPIDLWNAPQGGHVVLLGAKVKNLTSDTVNLKVRVRHLDTGLIVSEEGRTVKMVPVPDEPGVMQPDIRSRSQVSNVALCPNYDPAGIVDRLVLVEVTVTALYTQPVQTGQATMKLVPRCSTPDDEAFCRCECEKDYFLGKCGGGDGSSNAATPKDAGAPVLDP